MGVDGLVGSASWDPIDVCEDSNYFRPSVA